MLKIIRKKDFENNIVAMMGVAADIIGDNGLSRPETNDLPQQYDLIRKTVMEKSVVNSISLSNRSNRVETGP